MKDVVGKREEKGRTQKSTAKSSMDKAQLENFKKNCAALDWKVPGLKALTCMRQPSGHMISFALLCNTPFIVQTGACAPEARNRYVILPTFSLRRTCSA